MISVSRSARQPPWDPWPMDRLIYEQSILLGMSIDNSIIVQLLILISHFATYTTCPSNPHGLVNGMGMGNPCGLWVWVTVGWVWVGI
jgi:hypothetical protein